MPVDVLCFGFNTEFQRQLLDAWTADQKARRVDIVSISRKHAPHARDHATTAFKSARKVPRGKVGQRLKIYFLRLQYNWIYHRLAKTRPKQVLIYNGLNGVNYLASAACEELGIARLFFERAPLQDRLQIDAQGINFRSSVPRDMDFYQQLDSGAVPDASSEPYVPSRDFVKPENEARVEELKSQKYLFCPMQVSRDTQMTVFGGWVASMSHLLEILNEASQSLPTDVQFRIKEHPSSQDSFAEQIRGYDNPRLVLDLENDAYQLLQHCEGVVTVNSSVGLEAFMYDKLVITLGNALYSFGDLTSRAGDLTSLSKLMAEIHNSSWSHEGRSRLMKFLHFWFPPIKAIINGEYTYRDLEARDQKYQDLLTHYDESKSQ